jgi:hypothetical protein
MKWEYKAIKIQTTGFWTGGKLDEEKLDTYMNELGQAEWELVSAFDTNKQYGETRDVVIIFKRPTA